MGILNAWKSTESMFRSAWAAVICVGSCSPGNVVGFRAGTAQIRNRNKAKPWSWKNTIEELISGNEEEEDGSTPV